MKILAVVIAATVAILFELATVDRAEAYCVGIPTYCPQGTVAVCADYSEFPMVGQYVCVEVRR